ncbi:MAG: host-nuclease inhibitor Gam family protein [Desulfobacteraceae bacterium]|nr:host-nuclease inhibitor Gam family protein [Desulfobacteraceae bacterium]
MSRSKPNSIKPINDLCQANDALALIAAGKRTVAAIEAEMNAAIDRLKAEAEAQAAPLQAQIKAIEGGLQAFAEYNRALFKEKRSRELDHGAIGFRKSKELKPAPKHTWQMVLGRLKELAFMPAIRIKEEVNKEELATWPDERLELVGVRRVEKDLFWYEISQEKIAEKAA